jgi:hypothetical protein
MAKKTVKKLNKKQILKRTPKVDGLGPHDVKRLVTAIRKVWSWNYARKLCVERCTDKDGFGWCEGKTCKKKGPHPKIYADHIEPIGAFDPKTYLQRVFVSSKALQGLCKSCHDKKTREENAMRDMGLIV